MAGYAKPIEVYNARRKADGVEACENGQVAVELCIQSLGANG